MHQSSHYVPLHNLPFGTTKLLPKFHQAILFPQSGMPFPAFSFGPVHLSSTWLVFKVFSRVILVAISSMKISSLSQLRSEVPSLNNE